MGRGAGVCGYGMLGSGGSWQGIQDVRVREQWGKMLFKS